MVERELGRTGMRVRPVGFGAWAIGGFWGEVDDQESMRALHAAVDAGVNFIDTADVYGDGRSERLVGRLVRERQGETVYVATKAGRKLPEQIADGYSRANLTTWVDESLRDLGVDIDLLQLHCPPRAVFDRPEVFGVLDELVAAGKIRHYGVSVETVDEALAAIQFPNVQSVQIIFNMFRTKPAEILFPATARRHVGIIARVPLASGLLTGKLGPDSTFSAEDHRQFNRHGEMFDKGETFSGVPYDIGLAAVEELRGLLPSGATLAQMALRWILMFEAVTCVIPGAKTPQQARENAAAMELQRLTPEVMAAAQSVYDKFIRAHVHSGW
jgi:aryl-alcohol dehydrogenase-like predicted oxidoreductase